MATKTSTRMSAELQATCASLGYADEDGHYQREPDCLESIKDLIRFLKRDDETCSIRRQLGSAAILQNDLIPILKLIGSNLSEIKQQLEESLSQFSELGDDGEVRTQKRKFERRIKRQMEEERVFLETVLRLLVNLTQPACLCFREQIPDDKLARQNLLEVESYLLDYKESFVDEVLFSILSTELGNLLQKGWSDREEEDRMLIERIVLLVRNVLLIPTDLQKEQRTDDDASIHDQILWSLHSGGFIDLLLYIASSDDERALALHVLEITSLIFMEQTPDQLASCGTSRPADDKAKDTKELELMLDKERHSRRASILKCGSRHSRFGGTFQMKDFKSISDRDVLIHRTPTLTLKAINKSGAKNRSGRDLNRSQDSINRSKSKARNEYNDEEEDDDDGGAVEGDDDDDVINNSNNNIANEENDNTISGDREFIFEGVFKMDLSKGKVGRRKAKNRRPIAEVEVVRRSTFVVRSMLKEFCVQFLENCYNPLMRIVKDALIRSKAQENDESYYFKVMTFIMHFNRKFEFKSALVGETLSITTFHYVTTQLIKYHELVLSDKKDAIIWSKRMHLALRAYNELLQCIMKMDQSDESSVRESSRVIKSNIFYTMEYRDLFLLLLKKYDVTKQSRQFLQDLLEANHVFVRMLELTCRADRHLVIQRKKRRIRRRRRKKKKETTMVEKDEEPAKSMAEQAWDAVSSKLSAILQERDDDDGGSHSNDAANGDDDDDDGDYDVRPFDAASHVDVEKQRVDAVYRVQDFLRANKPKLALKLFRAAREVWPDRIEFGTPDLSPEDEFMALREICFTNLPENVRNLPAVIIAADDDDDGDDDDQSSGDDDDDERGDGGYDTVEQAFSFAEFISRYASPLVVKTCITFLENFKAMSQSSIHYAVKLLHRIGFGSSCGGADGGGGSSGGSGGVGGLVALLFQASLFSIFRDLLNDYTLSSSKQFSELKSFAIHVVRRFVEHLSKNNKMIVELFFYKSVKDAIELTEGLGGEVAGNFVSLRSQHQHASSLWSDEGNEELKVLFEEIKFEIEQQQQLHRQQLQQQRQQLRQQRQQLKRRQQQQSDKQEAAVAEKKMNAIVDDGDGSGRNNNNNNNSDGGGDGDGGDDDDDGGDNKRSGKITKRVINDDDDDDSIFNGDDGDNNNNNKMKRKNVLDSDSDDDDDNDNNNKVDNNNNNNNNNGEGDDDDGVGSGQLETSDDNRKNELDDDNANNDYSNDDNMNDDDEDEADNDSGHIATAAAAAVAAKPKMDIVDMIMLRLSDRTKTRRQVLRQLVHLDLISGATEVKKISRGHRSRKGSERSKFNEGTSINNESSRSSRRGWTDGEVEELKRNVALHLECQDPLGEIMQCYKDMGGAKSRGAVRKKILELRLVEDASQLKKKKKERGSKKKGRGTVTSSAGKMGLEENIMEHDFGRSSSSSSSSSSESENNNDDDDDDDDDERFHMSTESESDDDDGKDDEDDDDREADCRKLNLNKIKRLKLKAEKEGLLLAINWLSTKLMSVASDRDVEVDDLAIPLVPIIEQHDIALANRSFRSLLKGCGLKEPSNEQERYWRIPNWLTANQLRSAVDVLNKQEALEKPAASKNSLEAGQSEEGSSDSNVFKVKKKVNETLVELARKRKMGLSERKNKRKAVSLGNDNEGDMNNNNINSNSHNNNGGDGSGDDSDISVSKFYQARSNKDKTNGNNDGDDGAKPQKSKKRKRQNDDDDDNDDNNKNNNNNQSDVILTDDDDDDDGGKIKMPANKRKFIIESDEE